MLLVHLPLHGLLMHLGLTGTDHNLVEQGDRGCHRLLAIQSWQADLVDEQWCEATVQVEGE